MLVGESYLSTSLQGQGSRMIRREESQPQVIIKP